MRNFSAQLIFINGRFETGLVLSFDAHGKFLRVSSANEVQTFDWFEGILSPGFVNAHCHTELSHLREKIPQRTGMGGFIRAVQSLREEISEQERKAICKTEFESMLCKGVVGIGDIVNGTITADFEKDVNSFPFLRHAFVEMFGLNPAVAEEIFQRGISLAENFSCNTSVTIHAPYSCSPALKEIIYQYAGMRQSKLSFHCLESGEERRLFSDHAGPIFDFIRDIGAPFSMHEFFSPLDYLLSGIQKSDGSVLFVHNTEMNEAELQAVLATCENPWFVLCPGANRFIHGTLPDAALFRKSAGQKTCLGTDSIAGNLHLDLLREINILQEAFPEIPLHEFLSWATINGAKALGFEKEIGDFQTGFFPGLVHISDVDTENRKLTANSVSQRII